MKAAGYDLEERTAKFGEATIEFCLRLSFTSVTSPLITQLIKSATNVGANYCEADEGESKADFRHKIAICRKEARETKHWCRMLATAVIAQRADIRPLWLEAQELHLIFCKNIRTTDANFRAEKIHKPA